MKREANQKKRTTWCETVSTAKLHRLEWLIGKRGFIKIFSCQAPTDLHRQTTELSVAGLNVETR